MRHDEAGATLRQLRSYFATVSIDSWLFSPFLLEMFGLGHVTPDVIRKVRIAPSAVSAVSETVWDELMAGYKTGFLRLDLLGPRARPGEELLFGQQPQHFWYVDKREQMIFLDPVGTARGPDRRFMPEALSNLSAADAIVFGGLTARPGAIVDEVRRIARA